MLCYVAGSNLQIGTVARRLRKALSPQLCQVLHDSTLLVVLYFRYKTLKTYVQYINVNWHFDYQLNFYRVLGLCRRAGCL